MTVLHHAAFDLVVSHLGENLIMVKGRMSILPLDTLEALLDFPDDENVSREDTKKIISGLRSLGLTNICYVENPEEQVNTFLNSDKFVVSPAEIFTIYGSPSEIDFTMVGIYAQRPNRASKSVTPKQAGEQAKTLFRSVNHSFDAMWDTLGVKNARRIFPLAIYLDLNSH